jgi:hypothetical protein
MRKALKQHWLKFLAAALALSAHPMAAAAQVNSSPASAQADTAEMASSSAELDIPRTISKVLQVEFNLSFTIALSRNGRGGQAKGMIKTVVTRKLGHILADGFKQTGLSGESIDKDQFIDRVINRVGFEAGTIRFVAGCSYEGDTATVSGLIRLRDGTCLSFTDTLGKSNGRWKIIGRMLSAATKKPPEADESEAVN